MIERAVRIRMGLLEELDYLLGALLAIALTLSHHNQINRPGSGNANSITINDKAGQAFLTLRLFELS